MPDALGIAVLEAVHRLTRETYSDTDGEAVVAELVAVGFTPLDAPLFNLMGQLKEDGLLELDFDAYGDPRGASLVRLTSCGRDEVGSVDGLNRTQTELRSLLGSEDFGLRYPAAYKPWRVAEKLLWEDDTQSNLTIIGHTVREAMQGFATTMVETYSPVGVDANVAQVELRLGAVIAMHRKSLGKARREALEALGTLWEKANQLAQRQEHGAQKEGEPLTWSDARRVVWLSMFCMVEFATTMEDLKEPKPLSNDE